MTITPESQRDFYKTAFEEEQRENTRLRLILLWAAESMPGHRVAELIDKVKHDTVADMDEDDEEFRLKVAKAVSRITDLVQESMEPGFAIGDIDPMWWRKLDEAACQLRGFINDLETEGTLRKLRRLETKRRGEK